MKPSDLSILIDDAQVAADAYYNKGKPSWSDAKYDKVYDTIKVQIAALEQKDGLFSLSVDEENILDKGQAFLAQVGTTTSSTSDWPKVTHRVPMGSLNKAVPGQDSHMDLAELDAWAVSCRTVLGDARADGPFVVSLKYDGISCSLEHLAGDLTLGATRGDGNEGEDRTRNFRKMKGVKRNLKGFTGWIRGECVCLKSDLDTHFPGYANCRNTAAGVASRLDGVGVEHLTVYNYQLIPAPGGRPITRKRVEFQLLQKLGFDVPYWRHCDNLDDVKVIYDRFVQGKRDTLDFDIDGLVIEYDELSTQQALGEKGGRPLGAVALKFPHEAKVTPLLDVVWQVGNTGRLTPVAIVAPVKLAGVKVERASLHNAKRVRELGLYEGCKVLISRRNDVIPFVEERIDV